jgi:hypothetical protein
MKEGHLCPIRISTRNLYGIIAQDIFYKYFGPIRNCSCLIQLQTILLSLLTLKGKFLMCWMHTRHLKFQNSERFWNNPNTKSFFEKLLVILNKMVIHCLQIVVQGDHPSVLLHPLPLVQGQKDYRILRSFVYEEILHMHILLHRILL